MLNRAWNASTPEDEQEHAHGKQQLKRKTDARKAYHTHVLRLTLENNEISTEVVVRDRKYKKRWWKKKPNVEEDEAKDRTKWRKRTAKNILSAHNIP